MSTLTKWQESIEALQQAYQTYWDAKIPFTDEANRDFASLSSLASSKFELLVRTLKHANVQGRKEWGLSLYEEFRSYKQLVMTDSYGHTRGDFALSGKTYRSTMDAYRILSDRIVSSYFLLNEWEKTKPAMFTKLKNAVQWLPTRKSP